MKAVLKKSIIENKIKYLYIIFVVSLLMFFDISTYFYIYYNFSNVRYRENTFYRTIPISLKTQLLAYIINGFITFAFGVICLGFMSLFLDISNLTILVIFYHLSLFSMIDALELLKLSKTSWYQWLSIAIFVISIIALALEDALYPIESFIYTFISGLVLLCFNISVIYIKEKNYYYLPNKGLERIDVQ